MVPLSMQSRPHGEGVVILTVRGELDLASLGSFRDGLAAAVAGGPLRLVVDMTEVAFIDSTTIGVLVTAHRQAGAAGTALVVRPSPFVLRTLQLTGVADHLTVDLAGG